jgi:GNAT superfamily N-acetyltransferase
MRELRRDEIPQIAALWRRSRFDALPEFEARQGHSLEEDIEHFREVIAIEFDVWVAECDGNLVAFLATARVVLERLYVEPAEQGKGHGSILLDKAKQDNPNGLRLFTHQINTRARAFYEARGFRAISFGVSPPPESEPDVTYEWRERGNEHSA